MRIVFCLSLLVLKDHFSCVLKDHFSLALVSNTRARRCLKKYTVVNSLVDLRRLDKPIKDHLRMLGHRQFEFGTTDEFNCVHTHRT